jgi:hypothetical protein
MADHHHDEAPGAANYGLGLALVVLAALAALSYFGILIPANLFGGLAVVGVIVALILAFFNWVSSRAAVLFTGAVVALLAAVFWMGHPVVESKQYQAVFLTNGQVYFGKVKNVEAKTVTLTDIYYLQSNQQNPQQGTAQQDQPQLSLVKLGNELHGPEDMMAINRDQILFWENLKDSGKVVQAIKENQKK